MNEIVKLALLQQQANYTPYGVKTRYLSFAKEDTPIVNCGNDASINFGTGSFTIEFWMLRFGNGDTISNRRIMSKSAYGNNANENGFTFYGSINAVSFAVNPGGTRTIVGTGAIMTAGTWYHIAGVCDRSGNQTIYLDGVTKGSAAAPAGSVTNANYGLIIGCSNPIISTVYWDGLIDDVRIWNHARTQTQIQQHMNHKLTGWETGLVGYWRFDEGTGSTAYDNSQNSNDGTITGATWVP